MSPVTVDLPLVWSQRTEQNIHKKEYWFDTRVVRRMSCLSFCRISELSKYLFCITQKNHSKTCRWWKMPQKIVEFLFIFLYFTYRILSFSRSHPWYSGQRNGSHLHCRRSVLCCPEILRTKNVNCFIKYTNDYNYFSCIVFVILGTSVPEAVSSFIVARQGEVSS